MGEALVPHKELQEKMSDNFMFSGVCGHSFLSHLLGQY